MKKRSDEKPTKWEAKESSSERFADFNSGSHCCFYGPWTGYLVFLFKKQLHSKERAFCRFSKTCSQMSEVASTVTNARSKSFL